MLSQDSEDEIRSRFAFELAIWLWQEELNPRVRCAFGNVYNRPLSAPFLLFRTSEFSQSSWLDYFDNGNSIFSQHTDTINLWRGGVYQFGTHVCSLCSKKKDVLHIFRLVVKLGKDREKGKSEYVFKRRVSAGFLRSYILTTFWLHSDYILTTFWLHSDFILTSFWPHSGYIPATYWLFWLDSG